MNGKLGLGMAIPEDANAKLGPLPNIVHSNNIGREFEVRRPHPAYACLFIETRQTLETQSKDSRMQMYSAIRKWSGSAIL